VYHFKNRLDFSLLNFIDRLTFFASIMESDELTTTDPDPENKVLDLIDMI
jgi:hypothetical protein